MTLLTTLRVVSISPATTHGEMIVHAPMAHAAHAMAWVRSYAELKPPMHRAKAIPVIRLLTARLVSPLKPTIHGDAARKRPVTRPRVSTAWARGVVVARSKRERISARSGCCSMSAWVVMVDAASYQQPYVSFMSMERL
jgi:hypothetical protein